MAYSPKNGTSAKTRDGRKAVFVRYDDRNWPAPFSLDELAMIRDRFAFDNDPAGQAIAQRAAALIKHLSGGE